MPSRISLVRAISTLFHPMWGTLTLPLKRGTVPLRMPRPDTPGVSSFDSEQMELNGREHLQHLFPDFAPFITTCRFRDCAHVKETGCAVLEAIETGAIQKSRHSSYQRLYEQSLLVKEWDVRKT